jgi:quercetin dioxygenase-like cupin family protein
MGAQERVLGDIANHFLFENERVRVWSLDLGPGEASDWHSHDHDYVIVVLEADGSLEVEEEDGTRLNRGLRAGGAAFRKRGEVHRALNKSSAPYRNILIELK